MATSAWSQPAGGALALRSAPGGAWGASPAERQREEAERVYRQGLLPSGRPLRGEREGGGAVEGLAAACATCHRRSGLGSWEGQTIIPPIIGRYLFRDWARNVEDADLPRVQGYGPHRAPYTDVTLARAIRQGVDSQGRAMSYLMPRYALDDATMRGLIAYLRALTSGSVPGVEADTLHFATIVTPDADPVARRGMLAVLKRFFADKNGGYRADTPPLKSTRGVMYRVERKWELHVWELTGPPETWDAQLSARLEATPVFAVISGLGKKTWAPVHRFCEREGVPCLLPNVELPVAAEQDFFPVYFSRGVLLEAELIAKQLAERRPRRVVQLYRGGDVGEAAAKALEAAAPGASVTSRALGKGDPARALASALADVGKPDALVLWLRPDDVRALPAPATREVFVSGLMSKLEHAPLSAAWRSVARLTYPFDVPEKRKVRMNFPLGWFSVRHLEVVDERVQSDTYLACQILSETLGHMLDSFVREYLVERIEVMLSQRLVSGYYPRLGLAPGQRFASKGAYLVRFAGPSGPKIEAEGGWTVP